MATDMTGVKAKISLVCNFEAAKAIDLSIPKASFPVSKIFEFGYGDGAGEIDQIWWDRKELNASATEPVDVFGGVTNCFGIAASFTKVKLILVINRSDQALNGHVAGDAEITVGGVGAAEFQGPFNAAGDAVDVKAGAPFLAFDPAGAGWTASEGNDILNIVNKDGSLKALYDIVIGGVSN